MVAVLGRSSALRRLVCKQRADERREEVEEIEHKAVEDKLNFFVNLETLRESLSQSGNPVNFISG